jgi:hypothetical protein
MVRSLRLIKNTIVFLLLTATLLKPVFVFAYNSQINLIPVIAASTHHSARSVFTRNFPLSKTIPCLDKEKVEGVCLTPCFHKEWAQLESRSFRETGITPAGSLSFQSLNLRI